MKMIDAYSLTSKRTEYGKKIRKLYESHHINEQRKNMTELGLRNGGLCGTLTSVQKDNHILIVYEE